MSIRHWIKIVEAGYDNHNSAEKRPSGETGFMKKHRKPPLLNKDGKADPVDAEKEIPKQKEIEKKH